MIDDAIIEGSEGFEDNENIAKSWTNPCRVSMMLSLSKLTVLALVLAAVNVGTCLVTASDRALQAMTRNLDSIWEYICGLLSSLYPLRRTSSMRA